MSGTQDNAGGRPNELPGRQARPAGVGRKYGNGATVVFKHIADKSTGRNAHLHYDENGRKL